jgi:hypothetical protein
MERVPCSGSAHAQVVRNEHKHVLLAAEVAVATFHVSVLVARRGDGVDQAKSSPEQKNKKHDGIAEQPLSGKADNLSYDLTLQTNRVEILHLKRVSLRLKRFWEKVFP